MSAELFRMDATGTIWQEPTLFDGPPAPTLLDALQASPPADVLNMVTRRTEGTISARTGETTISDYLVCSPCGCRLDIGDPARHVRLSRVLHDHGAGTWTLPEAPAWCKR